MLAWPALSLLKNQHPDSVITVLIPSYTKPIAKICPWIDNIITDDLHKGAVTDALHLSRKLKQYNFDASISLYSEMRTSLALWLAHIPQRFGPATKLAQLFLNNKLKQKRSFSLKPEYEYNIDLIRHYISCNGDTPREPSTAPYLSFDQEDTQKIKNTYLRDNHIDPESKLIFIHAGSGGSAINLSLQQYTDLAKGISQLHNAHFVLTAGPDELDIANELSRRMKGIEHSVYHSTEGLVDFTKFIDICDLFISGSTGPLHIAAALNKNTVAFYPARRSATPLRWQTINEEDKRIYFSPDKFTGEGDMKTINLPACIDNINQYLSLND